MVEAQSVCVIGAGFSGLTSALILARNGRKVTLIEKSPRLGLTGRGFSREGVYFDTGLHYTGGLAENGIVSRYLRYLGLAPLDVAAFADDCFDEIRFADTGRVVRLPIGYEAMTEALCRQFPQDAVAVRAYMRDAHSDFDASSLLGFFMNMGGAPSKRSNVPLARYLENATGNAHLRATLAMHSLLYGVSPEEVSFTQHAYVTASYFDSVHNFAGGGRALVLAMERKLESLGVTIRKGTAVTRLHSDSPKRLNAVELDSGERIDTDAVVCTVHPPALAAMGKDVLRPAYLAHLRDLEETSTACMLFGIAEARPECLKGRNLFLCRDATLENSFSADAKPENGPYFVACSPQKDGGDGRIGVVVVAPGSFEQVRAWAGSGRADRPAAYKQWKQHVMENIRQSLVDMCPELAAVRFVDGATPLTMRDFLHTPHGGLYGCKHSVGQLNPMPMTRISNLWLAGQSIIAPGLMGTMISAFLACGFLVGHSTLHKDAVCG
ncbi:MAG: NAD(P)/FAD-dependent oxidoreductase [Desulfovibrio sp.]|jgi:all-trans-retinol 13,14-reductase|nr:NAD(P)/FAD-dependent oxidoreductase [Desulfovibrio sp.]